MRCTCYSATRVLASRGWLRGSWCGALAALRARERLSRSPSRPSHPGWLRCSSVTYQQYAPSSRLASRAPRPRSSTDLAIRGPLAARLTLELFPTLGQLVDLGLGKLQL